MGFYKAIKSVIWPLVAVLCFFLGYCSQKEGTEYIREMRQMERVPKVSANHIVSGEVSIEGTAEKSIYQDILSLSSLSQRKRGKRFRG